MKIRNLRKQEKGSKGITLIALVITIIVLLILAGVSIATLTGSNGILAKANLAKQNTEAAAVKEEIELVIQKVLIDKKDEIPLTNQKLAEYLGNEEELKGIIFTDISDTKLTGEYKGYDFEIDSSRRVKILGKTTGKVSYTLDPEGYTTESVTITITVEFKNDLTLSSITSQSEGVETVEVNKKFRVTQNGLYKFKMVDSNGTEKDINVPINKIDRDAPEIKIEIDDKTNYINGKAKAKVTIEDQQTGVNLEKCKWIINQSSDKVGDNLDSYTGNFESETQGVESEKVTKAGTTYYVHVIATDQAENSKEMVSEAITIKNGYAISTPQDLQNMKNNLSASYYVVNDINMEGFSFKTIPGEFTGTLDGQGHTISNFSIAKENHDSGYMAMFRCIQGNAKICNLLMKDVNISSQGQYAVGVFGAQANGFSEIKYNIIFEKVGITGSLTGRGIVASFVGDISNNRGCSISFRNCYARTDLNDVNGYDCSGLTCFGNYGNTGTAAAVNCYWSGTNNGKWRTGSLITPNTIDNNNNQQIDSCISISNSYYDKEKFPLKIPTVESASGKGLLTEEMKKQESYVGWDFENTWHMGEDGYPELTFNEFK